VKEDVEDYLIKREKKQKIVCNIRKYTREEVLRK
jgi:hypothetical protein